MADCVFSLLGIGGAVTSVVSAVLSVPVHDTDVGIKSGITAGATQSLTFKSCVLDPLAAIIANTIIHSFTREVVNWINSGFQGSPMFVSNPEGFFTDIGDQVAGRMIEDIAPFLCSPFDLQIRLSLGLLYSSTYIDDIGCRLSDVQKNIYNAFVGGQWGADGWSNWISVSQPSNNPYGIYLQAGDAISQAQVKKINDALQKLSWGRGFLSQEKCKRMGNDFDDEGNYICEEYETVTPGSVVENQLNQALGSPTRRFEVARDIDEILTALVNQALTQVMSGAGLLTSSKRTTASTYLGRGVQGTPTGVTATVTKPTGIDCAKIYRVVTDKTGTSIKVWDSQTYDYKDSGLSLGGLTPDQYMDQIAKGCANEKKRDVINEAVTKEGGSIPSITQDASTPPVSYQSPDGNIARGKEAKQSSIFNISAVCPGCGPEIGWNYRPSAEKAVDGSTDGNEFYGLSMTSRNTGAPQYDQWWQVDLADQQTGKTNWEISKIKIYGDSKGRYAISNGSLFSVFLTTTDLSAAGLDYLKSVTDPGITFKKIDTKMLSNSNMDAAVIDLPYRNGSFPRARYLLIKRPAGNADTDYLGIAEVQVFSPEAGYKSSPGAAETSPDNFAAFSPKTYNANLTVKSTSPATAESFQSRIITVTTPLSKSEAELAFSLLKKNGETFQTANLSDILSTLEIRSGPNQDYLNNASPVSIRFFVSNPTESVSYQLRTTQRGETLIRYNFTLRTDVLAGNYQLIVKENGASVGANTQHVLSFEIFIRNP